jgi:peptidoglycan/xylan/chitin deacetylase (PgdA/CDA1 family)
MLLFVILAVFLAPLFLMWKARYRYPPIDLPQALCYHKISQKFCFEGTWITPGRFLGHIDRLIDDGYRFVSEGDFVEGLGDPSPQRSKELLLTFDDGYEELHHVFLEHLVHRGVPLLVFLVSDYVGKANEWDVMLGRRPFRHLDWWQIEEMAEGGASFGSHGASHADLTRLPLANLSNEISGSKAIIEEKLGREVLSFSYPFGRYDARVKSFVKKAGYSAGFSLYPGHGNERVDRFALRRNGVYIIDPAIALKCKLERNPFFWFEEMKCRTINGVAVLTPVLKRLSAGPDK